MVHEAHGLDCGQRLINQFTGYGDKASSQFLKQIQLDEVTHVAAGMRWFQYVCKASNIKDVELYHELVKKHFRGSIRPPFNVELRAKAGMTPEWYEPLVSPPAAPRPKVEKKAAADAAGGDGTSEAGTEGKKRLDVAAVMKARQARKQEQEQGKGQKDADDADAGNAKQ
jgi:hypothetical protein